MFTLTAQELKLGGITKIKNVLKQTKDFIIQERGKNTCVVVDIDYFNELKMCELEIAFLKAKDEIEHDDYEIINDPIEHVQKLMAEINSEDKS